VFIARRLFHADELRQDKQGMTVHLMEWLSEDITRLFGGLKGGAATVRRHINQRLKEFRMIKHGGYRIPGVGMDPANLTGDEKTDLLTAFPMAMVSF